MRLIIIIIGMIALAWGITIIVPSNLKKVQGNQEQQSQGGQFQGGQSSSQAGTNKASSKDKSATKKDKKGNENSQSKSTKEKNSNKSDDKQPTKYSGNYSKDDLFNKGYNFISASFLTRAIQGKDVFNHMEVLKNASPEDINKEVTSDAQKMAFWINIYNGFSQHFLKKDPSLYKEDRGKFFSKDQINIAGFTVSLEDIEHGVLRRGATIWSKGRIHKPFKSDFTETFQVNNVDYRIHFALNCGAKGCPPVAVYYKGQADQQLNKAMEHELSTEVEVKKKEEKILVPAYMSWFVGDFDGEGGIRNLLKERKMIAQDVDYDVDAKEYDWSLQVINYIVY